MEFSILVRKIECYICGEKEEKDRAYKYLRNAIEMQNREMNQFMSSLYSAKLMDMCAEDRKELKKLYGRVPSSKKGSGYSKEIISPIGLNTEASVAKKVKEDFDNACKKGLMHGVVSLPTYKKDNPLIIQPSYLRLMSSNVKQNGFYHNYSSHEDFLDALSNGKPEVFIKFCNGITFGVVFGTKHSKKNNSLKTTIQAIFEETYHIRGSSLEVDNKGVITLNLSLEVPNKNAELKDDVVVGVDVGINIPAMCAINNNNYASCSIGSRDDFISKRTQLNSQYRRLQKSLTYSNGGHGRSKKMAALDRFHKKERNYVSTYNHTVSKRVVDFAVKNKAKYINIEDLSGFSKKQKNQWVLRNWSYHELQNDITYKAKQYGIEVRKINPYKTSQKCSCCGYTNPDNREDQSHFVCLSCGTKMNADFNAARNIAMSTDFVEEKSNKKQK